MAEALFVLSGHSQCIRGETEDSENTWGSQKVLAIFKTLSLWVRVVY